MALDVGVSILILVAGLQLHLLSTVCRECWCGTAEDHIIERLDGICKKLTTIAEPREPLVMTRA